MEDIEFNIQSVGLLSASEKPGVEPGHDIATTGTSDQSRAQRTIRIFVVVGISVCFLMLELLLLHLSGGTPAVSQTILQNPCGNSVSEAKARGCEWDVVSFCWLPEQCLDRELTQAFRDAGPWTYYGDKNKTISISEEEFGENERRVYLTNELHAAHCAFTWLKFHRALASGNMIHSELDITHTTHCSNVIQDHNDPDGIRVWVNIKFPDCGHLSADFPPTQ